MKKERTVKHSKKMKGRTNWEYVDNLSDEDIERAIAEDPDAAPILDEEWFKNAVLIRPGKVPVSIRIDRDVFDWFRQNGAGYQTRMNAVLRAFMNGHNKKKQRRRKKGA